MLHRAVFEYEISKSGRLTSLVTGKSLMLHINLMGNEVMPVKAFKD